MSTITFPSVRSRVVLTALLAVGAGLSGCAASAQPAPASAPAAEAFSIEDAWVKAEQTGMSAAFGVLVNDGSTDATVTSVTSDAASMIELHETVENESGELVMREIEGGFVLPADGTHPLEPGADHIMLMDLTAPLEPGDEVTFTVTFDDDSTATFDAPVKDYSGANETYEGDE